MPDNINWKKVETKNNDFLCKKCKSNDLKYHEKESFVAVGIFMFTIAILVGILGKVRGLILNPQKT